MTAEQIVSLATGGAGALLIVIIWITLLLNGKLHTDEEFKREVARGDELVKRLDLRNQSIEELQKALITANARADSAVRSTEMMADALAAAGQRRSRAIPKAP